MPCVDCVSRDFGWLAAAVAGVGWGFPGTPCGGYTVGVAAAEVGVGSGDARTLYMRSALSAQLKLKWVQGRGLRGSAYRGYPGRIAEGRWG